MLNTSRPPAYLLAGRSPIFHTSDRKAPGGSGLALLALLGLRVLVPETDVLFRVTIRPWSVGANWTGEQNGFFYQAVVTQADKSTASSYYVPFNGIRIGTTDGKPEIPGFHFIVSADVSVAGTSLEINACSSDNAFPGNNVKTPTCTTQYWSENYASALPDPGIPESTPYTGVLTLNDSAVNIADNGVYTDSLVLSISSTLSQDELDWLNDHLVFFDDAGNVYTNSLFNERVGVLSYEEATYLNSPDQNRRTRYGKGSNLVATGSNRDLFFDARVVAARGYRPFNKVINDIEVPDTGINVYRVKRPVSGGAIFKFGELFGAGPIGDALNLSPHHEYTQ